MFILKTSELKKLIDRVISTGRGQEGKGYLVYRCPEGFIVEPPEEVGNPYVVDVQGRRI